MAGYRITEFTGRRGHSKSVETTRGAHLGEAHSPKPKVKVQLVTGRGADR